MIRESSSPLARYLFAACLLLVGYASLYPFSGWRDLGVSPLEFFIAPAPRHIASFDVVANFIGYVPLGFLAVFAVIPQLRGRAAFVFATACSFALSFGLEAAQTYLPSRIASNLDLLANTAGGALGALIAIAVSRREHALRELRRKFFVPGRRTDLGLVLIALWLLSQSSPGTLLFGTGDLREFFQAVSGKLYPAELFLRAEAGVAAAHLLAVGMLASCLIAAGQPKRWLLVLLVVAALAIRSLAMGMQLGSDKPLLWMTPGATYGIAAGVALMFIAVSLPRMMRLALTGVALLVAVALVNLAPENPYLAASLAQWRPGYFLNFNGVTHLVAILWPFAAMIYLLLLAAEHDHAQAL